MPGSMIHLLLANKVDPTGSVFFYLGNIAPDAVVDWNEKEITHFRNLPDREIALKDLAVKTCPTDDFAKGVLLHLYFDWMWDILVRHDFINKVGADWFSKYREELSFASSYAFHNTDWAKQVWHQMDLCDISEYGEITGATHKQIKEFVSRNNKWHNDNIIGPSTAFTPTLIDTFTTQIANGYNEWIMKCLSEHV